MCVNILLFFWMMRVTQISAQGKNFFAQPRSNTPLISLHVSHFYFFLTSATVVMTPTPTPNPKSALDILAAASDASGKANDGQLQHPALTANCGAPVDVSGIAATSALATNPLVQAAAGIILQQRQQQQQQQQQQDAVQQLAQLHYLQTMAANASGANQAVTSQGTYSSLAFRAKFGQ